MAADQIAQKPLPPAAWCTARGLSCALSSILSRDLPAQVARVLCGTVGPLVAPIVWSCGSRLALTLGTQPPLLLCPQEQRFSEGLQTSQQPK